MRAALLAFALGASGCFNYVADVCPRCRTVTQAHPVAPPSDEGARLRVVLVPGAFGFGDEWTPITKALFLRTDVSWFVFDWPGPWKNPGASARALAATLQSALDGAPASTQKLIVIAHSAGGMIADAAVRQLRLDRNLPVELYGLDGEMKWRDFKDGDWQPNSPLGVAVVGGEREPYPPIPTGVAITHYVCRDPIGQRTRLSDGTTRIHVGARAGHNEMVAPTILPLLSRW